MRFLSSCTTRILPLALLCASVVFYQLLVVNSFFVITEGAGQYGLMLRQGLVPYRDFQLLLPPLNSWQIEWFQALFGDGYYALHWLGIVITCGIGLALFDILSALFNRWIAALASALTMVYYQISNTYFGYDLTQFLTLYLMLAGVCFTRYARASAEGSVGKKLYALCFAGGICLGLGILIKQSNGGMTTLFCGLTLAVLAWRLHGLKRAFIHECCLAAGVALPLLLTALALARDGALEAFISNTLVDAASAKGDFGAIFLNWMKGFFFSGSYGDATRIMIKQLIALMGKILAASLLLGGIWMAVRRTRNRDFLLRCIPGTTAWKTAPIGAQSAFVCVVGIAALGALILIIYRDACGFCEALKPGAWTLYNNAILWSVQFYLFGLLIALAAFLRRLGLFTATLVMITGFGVGITFGNGTSGGLSEISAFFGVALLLAFLIRLGAAYVLPAALPVLLMLIFISLLAEIKFSRPYLWWAVGTPDIRHITECAPTEGVFRHICMPPQQYDKFLRITKDITANSTADEPVYIYPHMLIFYQLSQRRPYEGKVVSWFDQMSDRQALAFSEKLRTAPPVIIVEARLPEEVYTGHERLFRGGQPSGQREIVKTIEALEASGTITRIDEIDDVNGLKIVVYKRRD